MKTWTTKLVIVNEIPHDYDLHAFQVYNFDSDLLGTIYPNDIDTMNVLVNDLDNGACPVADAWEDGMGNTCTIEGWGDPMVRFFSGEYVGIDDVTYSGYYTVENNIVVSFTTDDGESLDPSGAILEDVLTFPELKEEPTGN